ncbi:TetR/AcrR family transcriptional regulator [Kitasatospora sp. LaBMicrA B282]|uniref:TetR/AcrR family transcriptional regulator n=1 Tax=Kitasatospora sp. LaBMicrA B282 TaxID=3420949 RepID=UPI003D11D824
MAGAVEGGAQTKARLIEAAIRTLLAHGYSGASARTIAKEAGVNSALVFYHFGGVDALLLAAFRQVSAERLAVHRATIAAAHTLEELTEAAERIYRADIEGGHIAVFSELVGAAISKPELRGPIVEHAQLWLEFAESTLQRVIGGTPLAKLVPPRDLANAAMTFYFGVYLFTVLDTDRSRTESLFELGRRLAPRAKLLTVRLPRRRTARVVEGSAPPNSTASGPTSTRSAGDSSVGQQDLPT